MVVRLADRLGHEAREAWQRLRSLAVIIAQTSVAAGLAWVVADSATHSENPFFAPISAVVTLGTSTGKRYLRAVEMVLGVALGIGVGDALVFVIGTGGWQIAVLVAFAMAIAVVAKAQAMGVAQAASAAVLVASINPRGEIYFARVIDALVGGAVALVVMAIVLPVNPLAMVSRVARPALGVLIDGLADTARGLDRGDQKPAHDALIALSEGERKLDEFHEILPEGRETATLAPLRWRARAPLRRYVDSAEYIERAIRNARVLARRSVTLLRDGERAPPELARSVNGLAEAAKVVQRDLNRGQVPRDIHGRVTQAVRDATLAYHQRLGFSGTVVVAQIRAIATDLLGTTGLRHEQADREIRQAGGVLDRS